MQFVERPEAEDRKIHSKNEFELCYIRHKYLRKVKYNPTEEEMRPYMKIVEWSSRRTFYTYRYLFSTVGMEQDDIVNIGRIHLVNFLGLFEFTKEKNEEKYAKFWLRFCNNNDGKSPSPKDILDKNKADLTMFLKQRMEDLVRICTQKAKNIKGMKIDGYEPFYGSNPPPAELFKLLEDNEAYGYKRIDNVAFKAVKKRAKIKDLKDPFFYSPYWYVAVPLEQRNVTVLDLAGAGLDPFESEHNLNPEQILLNKDEEKRLDKKRKMFKNYTKDEKAKVILGFIEKNENNPHFEEEITIAKRFLREMGVTHVTE